MKHKFRIAVIVSMMLIIGLGLVACGDFGSGKKNSKENDTMADLYVVYGLSGDEVLIVVNGEVQESRARIVDGNYFIPASVASSINSCLYFNETEEQGMLTTGAGITYFYPDQTHKVVDGEQVALDHKVLTFGTDGQMYVDAALTGVDFKTEDSPNRIVIWTDAKDKQFYKVNDSDTALRVEGSDKAEVISYLKAGDYVIVTTAENGGYVGVTTETGLSGFVKIGGITHVGEAPESYASTSAAANSKTLASQYDGAHKSFGEDLLCVWHNMEYSADGSLIRGELDGSEGVDVIIPTWYSVVNVDGSISSNANLDYVQTAHGLGLKVLGLVNDFAPDVKGIDFLSNTNARKNFVRNIVDSAKENGLDGINVDFEYITSKSAKHYVQLMRELYLETKKEGLALTVCIYVPDVANSFYNYKALAELCDYVFVMTYDEHTNTDNIGPVASIEFVRNGVDQATKYIPANRLVMGIPLYTRLWLDDGLGNLSVQTLTYKTQQTTIEARGLSPVWQEEAGYNYVEYKSDAGIGQMWVEDTKSLGLKRSVSREKALAGVSCWCLGYQDASVWEVLK